MSLPVSIDPSFYASGAILPTALSMAGFGASSKLETMSIAPLHPRTGKLLDDEVAFQFWPETIQDDIEIGWDFKEIAGASHSLAEWTSNGGRSLSFEVPIVRTMLYPNDQPSFAGLRADPQEGLHEMRRYNENVEGFIRYMRAMCYPIEENGVVISPPFVALHCPNMRLNEDGTDLFYCVMTDCSITYERLFNNGTISVAKMSLGFKQIVQVKDGEPYQYAYFDTLKKAQLDENRSIHARDAQGRIKPR